MHDSPFELPITVIREILSVEIDIAKPVVITHRGTRWPFCMEWRRAVSGENQGVNSMHRCTLAVLLSGAIGIFVTGCSSTTPVMRGQSPQEPWAAGAVMSDGCPMCQSATGPGGQMIHAPNCDRCPQGQRGQRGHNGHLNLPFHPVHRNFHTYSAPQNLMYPPENSAPAMYQYPYYTHRGPTDFFMK